MGFLMVDVNGQSLSKQDQELIAHPVVAGVILFTRNYQSPHQLKALTNSMKQIKPDLLIAVDQEGGRVQRFREHFTALPSMRDWAIRYQASPQKTLFELDQTLCILVQELQFVGVNLNLMPVLDKDYGVSSIIGTRSLGSDLSVISLLAGEILKAFRRYQLMSTAKHFPGHGAVQVDSHLALPVDHRPLTELLVNDIQPYRVLLDKIDAIMPAHIVYPAVDKDYPAGFSRMWLQNILRDKLGFKGVIISDDLNMSATAPYGDAVDRVGLALQAGVNLVSFCNNRTDVIRIVDHFARYQGPPYNKKARTRFANSINFL